VCFCSVNPPVLLGMVHLGFVCSVFYSYILVLDLLTCYFAGVVRWALVARVAEYWYFGELLFF
jgi:hypothetical protein